MSKETFKAFARNHPELASAVMKGEASWQKFYELYDIYGENNRVWDSYFTTAVSAASASTIDSTLQSSALPSSTFQPSAFRDFFNTFKNIDLDSVQKGVTNLQKTVGLLQDIGLGTKNQSNIPSSSYEPRPMYKYFED